ncbi:class I SAM-dependent methyltransferase [Leadbettera azotonutricia]|uniref:Methyltransferase/methylase n=1 Tax=Leadbettera azotonutricia (strain ATCC BAA-888 / DSM 13862 / ZAS-9) TaxID=545695 RepID=F5Y9I2_LEAAZ|nr:class I SAM-dependent methyltransferase [Leadbettera azotonutricia]AEF82719.1 methyltransferase/methylase [Leadbettera azotonutricia ZAS-9]
MKAAKKAVKTWSTPVAREESRLIPCAICGGLSFKPYLQCEGFSYVRCTRCGLVQMNPQPLAEEVSLRYGTGHGADYLAYELENEKPFLELQLLALNDAGFWELKAGRVLDIGCATGTLLAELKKRGWDTAGVEICEEEAAYARRERSLDVRSLALEDARFAPASFDAVLASHVIEHLNDPGALVKEAGRILKPGGCFIVTTPNISGFQAKIFSGRWRSAIFDHLYLFSVKTLTELLKLNGFTIEKVKTWGGLAAGTAPRPIKRIADKVAKRFGFGDVMLIKASR